MWRGGGKSETAWSTSWSWPCLIRMTETAHVTRRRMSQDGAVVMGPRAYIFVIYIECDPRERERVIDSS